MNPRRRMVLVLIGVAIVGWILATAGFYIARNSRMTPEKVVAYLKDSKLAGLDAAARAARIKALADRLNKLSYEDRRKARRDAEWRRLFGEMTEDERAGFLEATLPTGFKQMISSFEALPEDKRKRAVDDAMRRLKQARADAEAGIESTNQPVFFPGGGQGLSEENRQKIIKMGLKSYYGSSSAQTKAEVAPLLEEMQKSMETGAVFRDRRP